MQHSPTRPIGNNQFDSILGCLRECQGRRRQSASTWARGWMVRVKSFSIRFRMPGWRGWRPTQFCGCCDSRRVDTPLEGFTRDVRAVATAEAAWFVCFRLDRLGCHGKSEPLVVLQSCLVTMTHGGLCALPCRVGVLAVLCLLHEGLLVCIC